MKTVVFLDADGVLIKHHDYFSVRYARDFNVDPALIITFFKEKYSLCAIGQADLKVELAKVLPDWGWQGTLDELLEYWFSAERERNEEVLARVQGWRDEGMKCYITTDQEKYRAEYLLNVVGLEELFDGAFVSCEVGYQKSDPEFFKTAMSVLRVSPEEVIYFDDDNQHVEIAKNLGVDARFYQGIDDLTL